MRKRKISFLLASMIALTSMLATGCSEADIENKLMRQTPTPAPTLEAAVPTGDPDLVEAVRDPISPAPTIPESTPTPAPTSTPAPRMIGTKTPQSKYVFLTNAIDNPLREIYMCPFGFMDWGKNLIPSETTIKPGERVQMFYDEAGGSSDGLFNMKFVDKAGNAYGVYAVELGDMESASLQLIQKLGFLFYVSLRTGKETNTMYGERLATTYEYSSSDTAVASATADPHEGDYNYGYYDANGKWVAYEYGDTTYTVYDPNTGTSTTTDSSGTTTTDTTAGTDTAAPSDSSSGTDTLDGSETITYYETPADETQYEGNPEYGYYDDYGNWMSYY